MYKIKDKPEDFFVKEVLKLPKGKGYGYFLLKKKDWNTIDAVRVIAKKLRIKGKNIKYAGLKDKKAITEQYISIKNAKKINVKIKDIELKKIGEGDEPIKLGGLEGNKFKIIVRNLETKKNLKLSKIENYFDAQRFSNKNIKIGKALLKRDYKELCKLLNLKNKGEVFRFDRQLLRFTLNSFQSYVFNKALDKYLTQSKKNIKLPLINFDTEFENKTIEKIYMNILEEEDVEKENFIFKEMPFLVSEGKDREIFVKVENFKYKYSRDERNKKKFKCVLEFYLKKGSYGTLVVKKLFS
ncbi:MAG: hypothetical protein CMH62_03430 [Nanoarchaeota archaeon]|nr:hypothetical protein [Nanoarchaeota archaeon]|tara:strand:+ start:1083 stop:1973 length:891 start_codon:yes stop_codon:yes gene_type:complete